MDATTHLDEALIPLATLGEWMDAKGLPAGEIEQVEPLGGGTQNVMIRFRRGGREYVLRRGPKHLRANSNDAMRREARVLAALADTDVATSRLIAACDDESVAAVFYLMEPVEGFNAASALPQLHSGSAEIRYRMGLAAAAALATLGAVDYRAVGLVDLGKPEGFLQRQVPRWLSELDSYRANDGYPGHDLPHVDAIADWLARNRPGSWTPGVMHGDYHLANVMFAPDGPRVAAIVDWEMCTIGDPLLDLGWLLATWPEPGTVLAAASALGQAGGLASRADLVVHYGRSSDRDLSAMTWYTVLASFKLAIILEGTYARACAGKAPRGTGELLHAIAVDLFTRARVFADEGI